MSMEDAISRHRRLAWPMRLGFITFYALFIMAYRIWG